MIKCLHCGAETSNGLALCDLCRRAAETYLQFVPVHFANLSRWRPGRAGSRSVPGSREPQGALGGGSVDRVARCLDEAGNDLTTRVRQLADDRGVEIPYAADEVNTVRVACWLLGEHLTSISTLDWCGDLVTDLRNIEERLRRLAEQVVPGWYAGACRTCGLSTYVVPGLTWVTCSHSVTDIGEDGRRRTVDLGCGATTYARDHLDVVLAEASDWIATPKRIAEAVVALTDVETSVDDLRKRIAIWGKRGHLEVIRPTEFAERKYRFGEVLAYIGAGQQKTPA